MNELEMKFHQEMMNTYLEAKSSSITPHTSIGCLLKWAGTKQQNS